MLAALQIKVPQFAHQMIEERIESNSFGGTIQISDIFLSLNIANFRPVLRIAETSISSSKFIGQITLSDLNLELELLPALSQRIEITSARAARADITANVEDSLLTALNQPSPHSENSPTSLFVDLQQLETAVQSLSDAFVVNDFNALLQIDSTGETVRLAGGQIALSKAATGLEIDARAAWQLSDFQDAAITFRMRSLGKASGAVASVSISGARLSDLSALISLPEYFNDIDPVLEAEVDLFTDNEGKFKEAAGRIQFGGMEFTVPGTNERSVINSIDTRVRYSFALNQLRLDSIHIKSELGQMHAEGQVDIEESTEHGTVAEGYLEIIKADSIGLPILEDPVSGVTGAMQFRLSLAAARLDIAELTLNVAESRTALSGYLENSIEGWSASIEFQTDTLSRDSLIRLWPLSVTPRARTWMKERVKSGRVFSGNGGLRLIPGQPPRVNFGFQFADAVLEFIKGFPPAFKLSGYGVLDDQRLSIHANNALVFDQDHNTADISGIEFLFPDILDDAAALQLKIPFNASAADALHLLDHEPLSLLSKGGIPTYIAEGNAMGVAEINIPLKRKDSLEPIDFKVFLTVSDFKSKAIANIASIVSDEVAIRADNHGIAVEGRGKVNGIPAYGQWTREFGSSTVTNSLLTGQIELSDEFAEAFSIPLPEQTINGKAEAEFFVTFGGDQEPGFGIVADAENLELSIPEIGLNKQAGTPFNIVMEGRMSQPIVINRIELSGAGLNVEGSINLRQDGMLDHAEFSKAEFNDWLKAAVTIPTDDRFAAIVTGGTVDLANASAIGVQRKQAGRLDKPILVKLDRVILTPTIWLSEVEGTLLLQEEIVGEFIGKVNGKENVELSLIVRGSQAALEFRSTDAGRVLRAAGLAGNFVGGSVSIVVVPNAAEQTVGVRVSAKDVRVLDMPVFSELLSMASIVGLFERLGGEGTRFSLIEVAMTIDGDTIRFDRAYATGSSIGLTLEGEIDRANETVDLKGVISPINLINQFLSETPLNEIGFGDGKGLGAISYTLQGPIDDPVSSTNPLNLITLGAIIRFFTPIL